jgi:hypothetical protein
MAAVITDLMTSLREKFDVSFQQNAHDVVIEVSKNGVVRKQRQLQTRHILFTFQELTLRPCERNLFNVYAPMDWCEGLGASLCKIWNNYLVCELFNSRY